MKDVEEFRWFMPARTDRGRPYLTRYHMDEPTARSRGALRPDPATRRVISVPETPGEHALRVRETDAGANVRRPWWMKPELLRLPLVVRVRWYDDQMWSSRLPG